MNDANKIRILEEALYTCRELREFDRKEIERLRAKVTELLGKQLESNKTVRVVAPHDYVPSTMHMGDCDVCGNTHAHPVHKV